MEKEKLIGIFDRQANQYERMRRSGNLQSWRNKLIKNVSGNILELAVGAGANFAFYPADVHLTGVDFSPKMLMKANDAAREHNLQAELILSDIETLEFPDNSFDFILSTLSFCGYAHPVQLLNRLNRWCKPDGEIRLMEHGLSPYPGIGLIQKLLDPIAYRMIGCHQDRDILSLIGESELTIQKLERHWLQVIHLVWAKPRK